MKKKYIIWNNKGRFGKNFLTYFPSTEYAKKNPDKTNSILESTIARNIKTDLLKLIQENKKNIIISRENIKNTIKIF